MTPDPTQPQENERSRNVRRLLMLLVAFSLVMASLICCGQVALLLGSSSRTVDTLSLLKADYSPWGYDEIAPIYLAGYKDDIQKDQARGDVAVVIPGDNIEPGVFWPTSIPTPIPVARVTETASLAPTELFSAATATDTATAAPTATRTPTISGGMPQGTETRTPTRTVTSTPPVATLTLTQEPSATPSPTRTHTFVPQPTRTHTRAPVIPSNTPVPPTRTNTPTRTNPAPGPTSTYTATPTRTALPATRTFTPTSTHTTQPTWTFTPTNTPITPVVVPTFTFTPTPTHTYTPTPPTYPLNPKVENGGDSDPDPDPAHTETGCLGFFGYVNTNPQPIIIPVGGANSFSATPYEVVTTHNTEVVLAQPTTFHPGEWSGNIAVKWDSGTPITWTLNGTSVTLDWCH